MSGSRKKRLQHHVPNHIPNLLLTINMKGAVRAGLIAAAVFLAVMAICLTAGFGPTGVVAGMSRVPRPRHALVTIEPQTNIGYRLFCCSISVGSVRGFHACGRSLRVLHESGYGWKVCAFRHDALDCSGSYRWGDDVVGQGKIV